MSRCRRHRWPPPFSGAGRLKNTRPVHGCEPGACSLTACAGNEMAKGRPLRGRPFGVPWLEVAGKTLTGWTAIDMDATLITAHSDKDGAAPTWKKGYGFHPLAAWCINTRERLAMLLRPGNAGSNTFADHKEVLSAALRQVPARLRRRLLIRVDGAGASHDLIGHLLGMSSPQWKVMFTCGWAITEADEAAITALPADAWRPGIRQDGSIEQDKEVAEPGLAPTRQARRPRPPAHRRPQPRLALDGCLHHLLEPPARTHGTRLTSINSPAKRKEDTPARSEPVHTRAHRDQHAPRPQEKRV
jgi:hypothetical protein